MRRRDGYVEELRTGQLRRAVFAAGCFWGVEDAFQRVDGVKDVRSGYTGGSSPDPSYEEVCSGVTGHAEAVEIIFDPDVVSYEQLLDTLWLVHDPTQVNRQGNDVGSQYRSAVFTLDEDQARQACEAVAALREAGTDAVTEIEPLGDFFLAEEYHQDYLEKNPRGYCHIPRSVLASLGERQYG